MNGCEVDDGTDGHGTCWLFVCVWGDLSGLLCTSYSSPLVKTSFSLEYLKLMYFDVLFIYCEIAYVKLEVANNSGTMSLYSYGKHSALHLFTSIATANSS